MKQFLWLFLTSFSILLSPFTLAQKVMDGHRIKIMLVQSVYSDAINSAISLKLKGIHWASQDACSLELTQLPGGEVFSVSVQTCDFKPDLQSAVVSQLESLTLPYDGFESVFQRKVRILLKK